MFGEQDEEKLQVITSDMFLLKSFLTWTLHFPKYLWLTLDTATSTWTLELHFGLNVTKVFHNHVSLILTLVLCSTVRLGYDRIKVKFDSKDIS